MKKKLSGVRKARNPFGIQKTRQHFLQMRLLSNNNHYIIFSLLQISTLVKIYIYIIKLIHTYMFCFPLVAPLYMITNQTIYEEQSPLYISYVSPEQINRIDIRIH